MANMLLVGVCGEESSISPNPAPAPTRAPPTNTVSTNSTLQTRALVTCWIGDGAPFVHVVRGLRRTILPAGSAGATHRPPWPLAIYRVFALPALPGSVLSPSPAGAHLTPRAILYEVQSDPHFTAGETGVKGPRGGQVEPGQSATVLPLLDVGFQASGLPTTADFNVSLFS